MDIVTYALCKKFALKVAAGFSSVTVDEENSTIIFTLNDGQEVSLKIPKPKDIKDISVQPVIVDSKIEQHIIFTMSNDTIIDAGKMPEAKINISKKEGNAFTYIEDDGYYVSSTGVKISEDENNVLEDRGTEDGLYAPSVRAQEEEVVKIIAENIETEDLDFSDFLN